MGSFDMGILWIDRGVMIALHLSYRSTRWFSNYSCNCDSFQMIHDPDFQNQAIQTVFVGRMP